MKTLIYTLILAFSFCSTKSFSQQTEWTADKAHTKIKFSATHMGISEVEGEFKDYEVEVFADGEDFAGAEVKVTIDANSLDSDNEKRDGHLRGEEFLDVSKYPEIHFEGELKEKPGEGEYTLDGILTIKGVSKPVQFDVKHKGTVEAMGATRAGFEISGTIDRFDYNVDWNQTFTKGLVVSKQIGIHCQTELNKK